MNQSIQAWLNQMIPMAQIAHIQGAVQMYFIFLAAFIVLVGWWIQALRTPHDEMLPVYVRGMLTMACMGISLLILTWGEQVSAGLVQGIAAADPQINWLVVNNPGDADLTMDFTQPFKVIAKYVGGTFAGPGNISLWELDKAWDYLVRIWMIWVCGFWAGIAVFIMEGFLILQKVIIIGNRLFLPIGIASLMLPVAHGTGVHLMKQMTGVIAWPVGWAIAHIGTMAALSSLQVPQWSASLGSLFVSGCALAGVCFCMILATIAAPGFMALAIVKGDNYAQHLAANLAGKAAEHAKHAAKSAGTVAGALAGSYAGPAGAAAGAALGAHAGNIAGMPIGAASEGIAGINGANHAIPSSRSSAVADLAVRGIKARA
jgi:hypothetical protein